MNLFKQRRKLVNKDTWAGLTKDDLPLSDEEKVELAQLDAEIGNLLAEIHTIESSLASGRSFKSNTSEKDYERLKFIKDTLWGKDMGPPISRIDETIHQLEVASDEINNLTKDILLS